MVSSLVGFGKRRTRRWPKPPGRVPGVSLPSIRPVSTFSASLALVSAAVAPGCCFAPPTWNWARPRAAPMWGGGWVWLVF